MATVKLDLTSSPPIFVLPTHLQPEELHETEDILYQAGAQLVYDAILARVFVGKVTQKKRAAFDLRAKGVWTEEAALPEVSAGGGEDDWTIREAPARKRARLRKSDDAVPSSRHRRGSSSTMFASISSELDQPHGPAHLWPDMSTHVLVLKLAWLDACIKEGRMVSFKPYTVYTARIVSRPDGGGSAKTSPVHASKSDVSSIRRTSKPDTSPSSILERARAEAATLPTPRRRWGDHGHHAPSSPTRIRPTLHRITTSEMEYAASHPLPDLPNWATGPNAAYSCCRATPMNTANAAFIAQLTKIKEARLLRLDDIGVRAYSTSIASLSAYPHTITQPEEITRLPGCEQKIATLWREWHDSAPDNEADRTIAVVVETEAQPEIQGLKLFWNIWGVGPDTARKFYYDNGWRDLDDVVEYGWTQLTRVQQIGVKYYDEFLEKIPRDEVEQISDTILRHARSVLSINPSQHNTPDDAECIIVGGYRRGKDLCGDVDVILSHRSEEKTQDLVIDVVRSLEEEGWITHTLTLHTTTSDRGGSTLPYRSQGHGGHGFDSLDKALCVWQDPKFESENGTITKNPNIHRRVDIIISTWRTVGCAVLGWSGGTTFQRDIRRFVSKVHGLKFDSSGVRNRGNGVVLDLEAPRPKRKPKDKSKAKRKGVFGDDETGGKDEVLELLFRGDHIDRDDERWQGDGWEWDDEDTWQARERRLMDGLGFGYRPATERCTG
jgi:DNA polymerase IV